MRQPPEPVIPASVLTLIARQWPAEPLERVRCIYRPDASKAIVNGLSHADAKALVVDQVVENDWRGRGDAVAITADEMAALADFCSGVGRRVVATPTRTSR